MKGLAKLDATRTTTADTRVLILCYTTKIIVLVLKVGLVALDVSIEVGSGLCLQRVVVDKLLCKVVR